MGYRSRVNEASEGTIRLRFTRRQGVVAVLGPMVVLSLLAVLLGGGGLAYMLVGAVVGSLVVGLGRLRAGLDLTGEHAVVRGLVSSTPVPWGDITGVEVVERATSGRVILETADRLYRPLAPVTSTLLPDPEFGSKADLIVDTWRARRARV